MKFFEPWPGFGCPRVGHLPGCPEKPRRHVAAQDKVWATRFTDAAGGNVVPTSRARTARCAVEGIGELPRQMPCRAEGPEAVKFLWREPPEYCGDIGHHGSLLADGA